MKKFAYFHFFYSVIKGKQKNKKSEKKPHKIDIIGCFSVTISHLLHYILL